jgi:hypothetical protein
VPGSRHRTCAVRVLSSCEFCECHWSAGRNVDCTP